MTYVPTDAFKNARTDANTAALEGNDVEILDAGDVVLATLVVPADAWNDAVAGVAALDAALVVPVTASGTAAKIRWHLAPAGAYSEGTVGLAGTDDGGTPWDVELSRLELVSGDTVSINAATASFVGSA